MKREEIKDKLAIIFNVLQHRDELEIAELVEEVINQLQSLSSNSVSVSDEEIIYTLKECREAIRKTKMIYRQDKDETAYDRTLNRADKCAEDILNNLTKKELLQQYANQTKDNLDRDMLVKYSKFLEEHGYTDSDWRDEKPTSIDRFKEEKEFENIEKVFKENGHNIKITGKL